MKTTIIVGALAVIFLAVLPYYVYQLGRNLAAGWIEGIKENLSTRKEKESDGEKQL